MKVIVIPILIGVLGTLTKESIKGLEDLEIRERMETIQMTTLRSTRTEHGEESMILEETCCHSDPNKKHQLTLILKKNLITIIVHD